MKLVMRLLRSGTFFVLFYMFVYDCARVGMLFGESVLSWAAFQGTRLLDLPGTKLFVWRCGEGELYNASRNLIACYKIGAAIPIAFVIGIAMGLVSTLVPGLRLRTTERGEGLPESPVPGTVGEPRTSGLAIASLVLALVGAPCLGFLLGFIAILFGAIASRQISSRSDTGGRRLAVLGELLGAIDIVIWTFALTIEKG